jgi:hypothetical protein
MTGSWPSSLLSNYVQSERRSPASRLHSSAPLHIIRRFTQYYRNDYIGTEQWSRFVDGTGYHSRRELFIQHVSFSKVWDRNIRAQGFAETFDPQKHKRG